eukprot:579443-Rhodomonas_salina.1
MSGVDRLGGCAWCGAGGLGCADIVFCLAISDMGHVLCRARYRDNCGARRAKGHNETGLYQARRGQLPMPLLRTCYEMSSTDAVLTQRTVVGGPRDGHPPAAPGPARRSGSIFFLAYRPMQQLRDVLYHPMHMPRDVPYHPIQLPPARTHISPLITATAAGGTKETVLWGPVGC